MRGTARHFPYMFAPALAAATLVALSTPDFRIAVMRDRIIAASPMIQALGVNPRDFVFRLDYLTGRLTSIEVPAANPIAYADLEDEVRLELKLDAELLVNLCPVFSAVSGADESFYNDDPTVPPDPVAFYVPRPGRDGRYALVVLLHGRTQTETDLLSHATLRSLADSEHAILIAPWGVGSELWGPAAVSEILSIIAEMERGFHIDPRRVYLAGLGSGGASGFRIAAQHPDVFNAVLSVGGAFPAKDAILTLNLLRDRDVYLVGEAPTYEVLAEACVPVSFYAAKDASAFYDIAAQFEQAWSDMFDGVVRNTNTRDCSRP
jgi:pimeloyl-ACP methyl ester carboxylesterase